MTPDPKLARKLARAVSMECPCCGALVALEIDTGEAGKRALKALSEAGYSRRLIPVEIAEEEIREAFVSIDVAGSTTVGGRLR